MWRAQIPHDPLLPAFSDRTEPDRLIHHRHTFRDGVLYVGNHVVGIGEAHGPVSVRRLVHRLDAHVAGSDVARLLGRAVRVAEPGRRGAGHRVTAPVERLVVRGRGSTRGTVRVEPHVHGTEIVVDLDARAGRLLALQVHKLGSLHRREGHAEVGHGHRVAGDTTRRERRLLAARWRRRVRHHRRYQRPGDHVHRL